MPKPNQSTQWHLQPPPSSEIVERFPELHPAVLAALVNRDLDSREAVDRFLQPDYVHHVYDPFLFRDMQKAVDRVLQVIDEKQKIIVHGDYDADGVCGATVLVTTFRYLGADVGVYLPHRETEGYGLNKNTVKKLADQGVKLIVTVDCGISNAPEISLAKELGVDVIVTDHHAQPPVLPTDAVAVINPSLEEETYPWRKLAGVGVAFKLCQALFRTLEQRGKDSFESFEKWLLDVVAISTVTDMMPLLDENRVFVKYGLVVLQKTRRPGLRAMFKQIGKPLFGSDARTLGFSVGPRINAAGRMDHANAAYNLMMSTDAVAAEVLAEAIERANTDRQKLTERIVKEAIASVGEVTADQHAMVVAQTGWSVGVMGLVASKVVEKTHRPSAVLTQVEDKWVGSGRSVEGFNFIAALQEIAKEQPDIFVKYGGHMQACGFTLPNEAAVDRFREALNQKAKASIGEKERVKIIKIDSELTLNQVNWELFTALQQLPPYGQANPPPVFLSNGVTVVEAARVGKTATHMRFKVEQNGTIRKAMCFGFGDGAEPAVGTSADIVYEVDVNEWNGNRELQLRIIDIRF